MLGVSGTPSRAGGDAGFELSSLQVAAPGLPTSPLFFLLPSPSNTSEAAFLPAFSQRL